MHFKRVNILVKRNYSMIMLLAGSVAAPGFFHRGGTGGAPVFGGGAHIFAHKFNYKRAYV